MDSRQATQMEGISIGRWRSPHRETFRQASLQKEDES